MFSPFNYTPGFCSYFPFSVPIIVCPISSILFLFVLQIRLLIHLPMATDEKIAELFQLYQVLLGLEYHGYKLVHSRPVPGTNYFIYNEQHNTQSEVATKYETVWLKGEV